MYTVYFIKYIYFIFTLGTLLCDVYSIYLNYYCIIIYILQLECERCLDSCGALGGPDKGLFYKKNKIMSLHYTV